MKITKEGKYPALRALCNDKGVNMETLAGMADITTVSACNKINGLSEWKLKEALKIKDKLGYKDTVEVLFTE